MKMITRRQSLGWFLGAVALVWKPAVLWAAVTGYQDWAHCDGTAGWTCDSANYSQALTVQFYADGPIGAGTYLGSTVSNASPRPDAAPLCGGNVNIGFGMTYGPFQDGKAHTIYAYALGVNGVPTLLGSSPITTAVCPYVPPEITGHLDAVDTAGGNLWFAGWAADSNYSGPINVQIYVDGQYTITVPASQNRSDVGSHVFGWFHNPFGAGTHTVRVYGVGVDASGNPNGHNVEISGSPQTFNVGCQGLVGDELGWCQGNPNYWINRQANSKALYNSNIRILMDSSLNGAFMQLYGADWTNNLMDQHGGAATQLSMWGNEMKGGQNAYFYINQNSAECDPTPYPTQAACEAAHAPGLCVVRGDPTGAQVANCTTVKTCTNNFGARQDAGLPFNLCQAQGLDCGWTPAPITPTVSSDNSTWSATITGFNNFFKTSSFPGVTVNEQVQLGDAYAEVTYDITYNGPYVMRPNDQEIPANFTAHGMIDHMYYYTGPAYSNVAGVATRTNLTSNYNYEMLMPGRLPKPTVYQPAMFANLSEGWWTECNPDDTRCVTVAGFDPIFFKAVVHGAYAGGPVANASGYSSPMGYFNFYPGAHYHFSMYLFPYNYNAVVAGKSIRQRIFDLHASYVPTFPGAPPVITSPQFDATPTVGAPYSYHLTFSGSPLNYTAVSLPPGLTFNAASQMITGTPTTPGNFTADVSATNATGSNLQNVTFVVQPGSSQPPSITQQPVSQTVAVGQTVTFSVTAAGTAPLNYQWYKNNLVISGAIGSSYTTPSTTAADNGAQFTVTINNITNHPVSSNAAILTVNPPITGTSLVTSMTSGTARTDWPGWVGMQVQVGNTPLTVAALGRIYLSGNSHAHAVKLVQADTGQDVPGGSVTFTPSGTSGQFSYAALASPVTLSSNTLYYLVSHEQSGGDSWYNADARITTTADGSELGPVYSADYAPSNWNPFPGAGQAYGPLSFIYSTGGTSNIPPSISQQPASAAVTAGQTATFSVAASGTAPLSYQWYRNGSPISGANGTSYTTPATTAADNGAQFTVIVNNVTNQPRTSGTAILTVQAPVTGASLVTSSLPGALRNGWPGWVGMEVQVGNAPLTVSALGRIYLSGNNQAHAVKLVLASTGQDVPGGSVTFTPSGTPGQFSYAALASPAALSANTLYYLVSHEFNGGDTWYHANASVVTTADGSVPGYVYSADYSPSFWSPGAWAGHGFGPLSFVYTKGAAGSNFNDQPTTVQAPSTSSVRVRPDPFRANRGNSSIIFDQMPAGSTVKIFTVSARWVKTLTADGNGSASWDLTNDSGDRVASGLYLYLVTDSQGSKTRGKFAIIR